MGQLGLALKDRTFEHDTTGDCPQLDDMEVAYDIAFCAAEHLRRLSEIQPPDSIAREWRLLRAKLVVFHVLADRLALAGHSTLA